MIGAFLHVLSRQRVQRVGSALRRTRTGAGRTRLGAERLEQRKVLATLVNGDFGWAITAGKTADIEANHVAADSQGNVYVAGEFYGPLDFDPGPEGLTLTSAEAPGFSFSNSDVFLAKYSPVGELLWLKQFGSAGDDSVRGIAVDAADNVTMTGHFEGQVDFDPGAGTANLTADANYSNVFVAQITSSGAFRWARQFEGAGRDEASALAVDSAGNVIVSGKFFSTCDFDPGPNSTIFDVNDGLKGSGFVASLSNTGEFRWAKQYNGTVNAVAGTPDGNVLVAGTFYGRMAFDPTTPNRMLVTGNFSSGAFLLQLAVDGAVQWGRSIGGAASSYTARAAGLTVAVDVQRNVLVGGYFLGKVGFEGGVSSQSLTSAGNTDGMLLKWSPTGQLLWAQRFGSIGYDRVAAVTITGGDQPVIAGEFEFTVDFDNDSSVQSLTSAGDADAYVLGLKSDGAFRWTKQFGGRSSMLFAGSMATRLGKDALLAGFFINDVQALGAQSETILEPADVTISVGASGGDRASYSGKAGGFAMLVRDTDSTPPKATFSAVPSPLTRPLSSIDIRFSESVTGVDLTDFLLTQNGIVMTLDQLSLSGAGASYKLSSPTPITLPVGSYTMTLKSEGSGISDTAGNAIAENASVTWAVGASDTTPPAAQFSPVPSKMGSALPSISITFTESVNGVDISAFTLTRNDVPVPLDGATIIGEDTSYTLKGLAKATEIAGAYKLTLNAGQAVITDATGNILTQSASVGWILIGKDTQAPTATFAALSAERASALPSIGVTFSEPVYGVDINDFLLTRDGERVPLVGVKVIGSAENYIIQGLGTVTSRAGSYALQIRPGARIVDAARNSLSKLAGVAWKRAPLTAVFATVDSAPSQGATNFNLKFSLPVSRPNWSAFRLSLNGRGVSLSGASLTRTAGDSFVLTLPPKITALKGTYVLTFSGPRSQVSSDGLKLGTTETVSWRKS
jgi:hypothetical protein